MVIKLADNLEFIQHRQGKYPYCHSLVIRDEVSAVIDPSSDKEYLTRLAREDRVATVLLSHYHEDHQKYNYLFPEARFFVPQAEAAAYTSMESLFEFLGIKDTQYYTYWRQTLLEEFNYRPLKDLHPFKDGDILYVGQTEIQVLQTPGHTPGHSCFFFPEQDILYLADIDLTSFGPWYGDEASDLEAMISSIQRLQNFQAALYLTSHGMGMFSPPEAKANLTRFLGIIHQREEQLLKLLRRPHTLEKLVKCRLIYQKPLTPQFVYDHIEAQMITKHLCRLIQMGQVEKSGEEYVVRR